MKKFLIICFVFSICMFFINGCSNITNEEQLFYAVKKGDFQKVQELVEKGTSVNCLEQGTYKTERKCGRGVCRTELSTCQTPLAVAYKQNTQNKQIIEFLKSKGAKNIDEKGFACLKPLLVEQIESVKQNFRGNKANK